MAKTSILESRLLSTKIKSANAKLFPEGALGYFLGPTLALIANSVLANYFNKYLTDVLNITTWAAWFFNWLPVISVIFVVIGNILVGRLMNKGKSKAGKARPLLLLSVPLSVLALLILFVFSPFANDSSDKSQQIVALVMIAIGYNLWFAIAYPFYYTPHAGLVNLSTRNSKHRSLLATISNATTLAAMGLCTMILPFFLNLLFVNQMDPTQIDGVLGENYFEHLNAAGKIDGYVNSSNNFILDQTASYNHWKIFVLALVATTTIGVLLEYFFTRERVTEERIAGNYQQKEEVVSTKTQAKICLKDKYWWIIIVFFVLYQFGGMIKNVSQLYFCSAMFGQADANGQLVYSTSIGGSFSGTIAIIGAVPTTLGMVLSWPLSNKIGKGKAILAGAVLSSIGGAIGFIAPDNFGLVCVSFAVKALGSTPAMYLSLALLADILDHQEAIHGVRTDGLTMTIYGAIMAGMTGIATGVLNLVLSGAGYSQDAVSNPTLRVAMPWVFIGAETICYVAIALLFIFMGVEKFSELDHKAIEKDQRQKAEEAGVEYISAEQRLQEEEKSAFAASEEARNAELKLKCKKKGLDFDKEESDYQAKQQKKRASDLAKKQKEEQKKAEREEAARKAYQALSPEKKAAIEKKQSLILQQFNDLRTENNKTTL